MVKSLNVSDSRGVVLYMKVSGEFPYFYFLYEKFLNKQKKSIKSKQASFTKIFKAHEKHKKHRKHKKHKKHKKQYLLTYFMHLKT